MKSGIMQNSAGFRIHARSKLQGHLSLNKMTPIQSMNKDNEHWFRPTQIDPRDNRIIIPHDEVLENINNNQFDDNDHNLLRKWLVKVYEIINSDAFIKYHNKELNIGQTKAYAAKNILLNIYQLIQKLSSKVSQEVRNDITTFINEQSKQIAKQILLKYPQASATGASRKLKKAISRPDNRQNDQFDLLLYCKDKKLNFQYKDDSDYSSQIMRALNYIVNLANQPFAYKSDLSTNYEMFQDIMEQLFQLAGVKEFQNQFITVAKKLEKSKDPITSQKVGKMIGEEPEARKKWESVKKQKQFKPDFKINQKIPSSVKVFSQQEIQAGDFRINHVSVLRIITKWTQQLREKLQQARSEILLRVQMFKTKDGSLVYLKDEYKNFLYEAAIQQQKRIAVFFKDLQIQCLQVQQQLLADRYQGLYSNNIDTNIGIVAARTQACVGQYMFMYLNQLIHSLLLIPKKAKQKFIKHHQKPLQQILQSQVWHQPKRQDFIKGAALLESINLITFKVGDLIRCKCNSVQSDIIALYKMFAKISQECPKIFKIVRVKDRLDGKDNDILMNLFFMGRMQCEVQLSVRSSADQKQDHFNNFNHFIYELNRAQLGPIAECGCILAQYDPLVNNYTSRRFLMPQTKSKKIITKQLLEQNINILEKKSQQALHKNMNLLPFFCSNCRNLNKNVNPIFYAKRIHCKQYAECNRCYANRIFSYPSYKQKMIKQLFRGVYMQDSQQLKMIEKHFDIFRFNMIKDVQNLTKNKQFKNGNKGILVMLNNKKPVPQYFEMVQFLDCLHFVISSHHFENTDQDDQKNQNQAYLQANLMTNFKQVLVDSTQNDNKKQLYTKIILTIDLYQPLKKMKEILNSAYFLLPKQSQNGIGFDKGLIQQENNGMDNPNKLKTVFKCNCCKPKKLLFGPYFDCKMDTYYTKNKEYITDAIKKQKQIMNLPNRNITDQLKNLPQHKSLKRLYAYFNDIRDVSFITKLPTIQKVQIDSNWVQTLDSMPYTQTLLHLSLNQNELVNIKQIKNCPNLVTLRIDYNHIQSLEGVQNCVRLKIISCQKNQLKSLKGLQSCNSLQEIVFDQNKITDIESIRTLENLRQVKLYQNKISSIDCMKNLKKVEVLDLSQNQLKSLSGIQQMSKLRILQFDDNQIDSLLLLQNCLKLTSLHCENNKLTNFKGLSNCLELNDLICDGNNFQSYEGLQKCVNLKWINENRANLDKIPQLIKMRGHDFQNKLMKRMNLLPGLLKLGHKDNRRNPGLSKQKYKQ